MKQPYLTISPLPSLDINYLVFRIQLVLFNKANCHRLEYLARTPHLRHKRGKHSSRGLEDRSKLASTE